ncbi:MAG: (E)-4-hydroxy-3-methylbut-2-enyl-diphosphate synthase [Synergistaceae bacterium]|jgi:(E)-4-hydroxy-3-methylbut-2-enyl-diphosphate synthase|nr:(E)-4-hydroxy-3-methylbut-2-enyl-diphosphate synthase [Synergistaceae bacterium]
MGSSKFVNICGAQFGGGAPVRVESMLKTPLDNADGCIAELDALRQSGCELARVAFPDERCKADLKYIAEKSGVPVMADIHFNHKFAVAALDCGVTSIRINPGNMTNRDGLASVISAAKANGAVIRIGANGGSLGSRHTASYEDRASALVGAVEEQVRQLTDMNFQDIIISAKSSSVPETVRANFMLSAKYPFPLHIGITEAGGGMEGAVKSASGLAVLLSQGIGDSVRVSLTGDSVSEVRVAYAVLRSLELRKRGVNMISCPGCGRRRVDVGALCERVKAILPVDMPDGVTIAVMGCEVNGPREAAAADIGIAGTKSGFILFKDGNSAASGEIGELEKVFSPCLRDLLAKRVSRR